LVLVGAVPQRPYERPPLSKGYLQGSDPRDGAYVHDADWYGSHDVDLRLGDAVTAVDVRAHDVLDASGTRTGWDHLVLATGSEPRRLRVPGAHLDGVGYLRTLDDSDRVRAELSAGLKVDGGVVVDAHLRSSNPHVLAVGDIALAHHPFLGTHVRVEHWANALNQPATAAATILGRDEPYDKLPYFFSDQFDLGMEYIGWVGPHGYDRVVVRGDLAGRELIAFWLREGRVLAGMNVNVWDVVDDVESLIRSRAQVDVDRLADPDVPLRDLL
jgi:NADPH-dependent 2,4-dienoyl-CoA reductase/sulfur reductase-like enzyme